MQTALFLFSNSIIFLSSFAAVFKGFKGLSLIDSLIAFILVFVSQVVFTEQLLGIFGILSFRNLLFLNVFVLFVVLIILKNKPFSLDLKDFRTKFISLFQDRVLLFGFSVVVAFGLVKLAINLVNSPFGWDDLNYHFTYPVEWLKHGNLYNPITISDDPSPPYYPINGSLFFLWLIFPFRSIFIADIGQLPFFILAFLSCYSIARKVGLDKRKSFYSAVLCVITPNFFKQLEIAYVDVMVGGLFLAALNYLLLAYKKFKINYVILWSLSFALFLGTKTSAVVYGMPLFLFFCWILAKNLKKVSAKLVLFSFAVFFFIAICLGSFAYIRNIVETGNPLYPADIKVLGVGIFKGVMPISTYRARWGKEDFNLEKFHFHEGMGGQFIIFVIPALFLGLPLYLLKKRKEWDIAIVFILLLPIILALSFWYLMPQLWVRYLYPFLGVAFVAAIFTFDLLKVPQRIFKVLAFLSFFASAMEFSGGIELAVSVLLTAVFFLMFNKIAKFKFNFKSGLIFAVFLFISVHFLSIDYTAHEYDRYVANSPFPLDERVAWKWINDNTSGSRIAYMGKPDLFPLYGSNFKNDVIYVSVNKVHPVKLHYFPDGWYVWKKDFMVLHKGLEKDGNYREKADYKTWLSNLKKERIDYLVIYSLHQVPAPIFSIEEEWATSHPEVFTPTLNNMHVHIYKINK